MNIYSAPMSQLILFRRLCHCTFHVEHTFLQQMFYYIPRFHTLSWQVFHLILVTTHPDISDIVINRKVSLQSSDTPPSTYYAILTAYTIIMKSVNL